MLFEKLCDVVYIPTNCYPAVCLAIVFGNIVCGQHFGFMVFQKLVFGHEKDARVGLI